MEKRNDEKKKPSENPENRRLGRVLTAGMVHASDPKLRTRAGLAARLEISESTLSNYVSGTREIPWPVLSRAVAELGLRADEIFATSVVAGGVARRDYEAACEFLSESSKLGIVGVFPNRSAALDALAPYVSRLTHGSIMITCSSMRGLVQDLASAFVRELKDIRRDHDRDIDIKVLMTHVALGGSRERNEHRPSGAIMAEIVEGIDRCLDELVADPDDIRSLLASPSCFCVFLEDGYGGIGLLNPYPLCSPGFSNLTLLVRGDGDETIYRRALQSDFLDPWQNGPRPGEAPARDEDRTISIPLPEALAECLRRAADPTADGRARLAPELLEHVRAVARKIDAKLRSKRRASPFLGLDLGSSAS